MILVRSVRGACCLPIPGSVACNLKGMAMIRVFCVLAAMAIAAGVQAEVYKCTTPGGATEFSDTPCPAGSTCGGPGDCLSKVCTTGVCAAARRGAMRSACRRSTPCSSVIASARSSRPGAASVVSSLRRTARSASAGDAARKPTRQPGARIFEKPLT